MSKKSPPVKSGSSHAWDPAKKSYVKKRSFICPMKGSNSGVIIAVLVILIILMALLTWGVLIIDWSKVLT